MRVALSGSFAPIKAPGSVTVGRPLLVEHGADAILGWNESELAKPLKASASTLFGPRGVCLDNDGRLWVCDTGHHRLLCWHRVPEADNHAADLLIGQPDFFSEGRNARGAPSAATLNVPTGICAWAGGLAVADAWNHRVLLWHQPPTRNNQPADIILGQDDADAVMANRGADHPGAATLYWPYGVGVCDGALMVADSGNRRVAIWRKPSRTGQPADVILGQPGPDRRDENAGAGAGAMGMRWPHGIASWKGMPAVSDAGNNRIMLWDRLPLHSGTPCDRVLGQAAFTACDHNGGAYYPSAGTLNMPYGLAVAGDTLLVADTANSRLVGFQDTTMAANADRLCGQSDFASKGDNAWRPADRTNLCWPYGVSVQRQRAAIADSGNNRVMLWTLAEPG